MGKAMFYHLTRSTVEETLRLLLPKAVGQGWPVFLRGRDEVALARLDEALWLVPEDSFLAHGREGGAHDTRQPVLLGQGPVRPETRVLALVDGAATGIAEAKRMERLWVIFDAADSEALDGARALWREITGAGMDAEYWSEESGRWAMKLERKAGSPPN